jgi:N-methylhydantoinase A
MAHYELAIDIGGTFTDVVLIDLEKGHYQLAKTPSTPDDPARGFLTGLTQILSASQVQSDALQRIYHGTTIATNAILEGRGATVGLIVTDGFKYVLEIARHAMGRLTSPYTWMKPARPIPPENIYEIPERLEFDGQVVIPLDEAAVRQAARQLQTSGIDAIAVSLLHAYANPAHEQRIRELVLAEHPTALVSLSSEVLPVFREYERTMTTVLNAYVMPQVSHYIANLSRELKAHHIDARLLIMQSSGGVIGADSATQQPVYTALSGPAAGVMGAQHFGQASGFDNLVSFDMGGTSTDVSLITKQGVTSTAEGMLGDWPMQLPMLDIHTIGAGGGSIAWLTPSNNLMVGPRSAGAEPGPVCYERGGTEPTVTDANLVLGRIAPALLDGGLQLNVEAAKRAIEDNIARPLGLDLYRAASGILQIVDNNMMGAIRAVSIERGHDPRQFALLAFGGAGPMHATEVAQLLDMPVVCMPRNPGVASAYGLLVTDFKNDYARTFLQRPPHYDFEAMQTVYLGLEGEGQSWLEAERVPPDQRALKRSADLRYAHQGFEVTVDFEAQEVTSQSVAALLQNFHQQHKQLYGFALEQAVEIVTLRVSALGQLNRLPALSLNGETGPPEQALIGKRPVYFEKTGGFVDCPRYRREKLAPNFTIAGPAILEQTDSTLVVSPGWWGQVDASGNLILRPDTQSTAADRAS